MLVRATAHCIAALFIVLIIVYRSVHREQMTNKEIYGTLATSFYAGMSKETAQVLDQGAYLILVHTYASKAAIQLVPNVKQLDTIYYVSQDAKIATQFMLRALGYDLKQVKLEQTSTLSDPNRIYALLSTDTLLQTELVKGFVSYAQANSSIIKRLAPYVEIQSKYSRDLAPNITPPDYLQLIYIPMMATSSKIAENSIRLSGDIVQADDQVQQLHSYLKSHAVIEPFKQISVMLPNNARISHMIDQGEFQLVSFSRDTITYLDLQVGDKVQYRTRVFYVVDMDKLNYHCATDPYILYNESDVLRDSVNRQLYIEHQPSPEFVHAERIYVLPLKRYARYNGKGKLVLEPLAEDTAFKCYTNPLLASKEACESSYDGQGFRKTSVDIWDAPCKYDADCPFYRINKRHGGCMAGGYCEMPLGTEQLSYRKYASESKPICYGCAADDMECCEKNPDFAFQGDTLERMNSGLPLL